tara:strand:- start:1435 stop:2187 length:753 start_codon:yes stop_codon:yes gene_type:complete
MKILIILCLFPALAWSKLDYSSQNLIRTYPMGLFASGTVGYAFKVWDKSDINPALYGYIRPSATLQTSGPVNQAKAQLDFAPVAFANFYTGAAIINRDYNELDTFDCSSVICRAKMYRQYVGFKMALKYKSIFMMTDHRFSRVKVSEKRGVFAEEMGTLLGSGSDDVLRVNQLVIGTEFNDKWAAGAMVVANAMEKYTNSTRMHIGFVRRQLGHWNILAGAGTFHTRANSDVFTTLFLFQWSGERGLTLF